MNDKNLQREVDSVTTDLNHILDILVNKIEEFEQEVKDLEKQHQQALDEAYDKGYNEGYKNSVIVHSDLYK